MASHKERMSSSAYSTTPGHLNRMTSSAYTTTATNERLGLYAGSTTGQSLEGMTSPACTHTPTNEKERWGLCSSPSLSQSERMPLSACTSPSPGWDEGEAAANWLDYRLLFEKERQEKEVRHSLFYLVTFLDQGLDLLWLYRSFLAVTQVESYANSHNAPSHC